DTLRRSAGLQPCSQSHGKPEGSHDVWASLDRLIAAAYLVVGAIVGVLLIVKPMMPTIANTTSSYVVGLLALVRVLWLAAFDHVAVCPLTIHRSNPSHLLRVSVATAVCVWGVYLLGVPFRLQRVAGIQLSIGETVLAAGSSAVAHLFVFTIVF